MGILKYDPNNSGGRWWLTEEDYVALEEYGWTVHWAHENGKAPFGGVSANIYDYDELLIPIQRNKDLRYLGSVAGTCAKRFDTAEEGVREWEDITGQRAGEVGCNCCGRPHDFEFFTSKDNSAYMRVDVPHEGSWGFN